MPALVEALVNAGVLKTPRIIEAFRTLPRADFVGEFFKELADVDQPLPIGFGQTISQPWTVAFMLELLNPRPGNLVLEIGAGSGWVSALLGHIVGPGGQVIGIEIVPSLRIQAARRMAQKHIKNVEIREFDGSEGYPARAPYDRILGSAASPKTPRWLLGQLAERGVIVFPVGGAIERITLADKRPRIESFPYFAFVPLVGKRGQG